jgi:membrane associated rhomboid family serine protease
MRVRYNAPTTLTFTLLAALVLLLDKTFLQGLVASWFSTPIPFRPSQAQDYVRMVSFVLGHESVTHYIGNFTFILLLGPILESSYSSLVMLLMMIVTAIVTGILNIFLFPGTTLLGASGIVFMMILLASITNFEKGEIPLTFILVIVIYLGKEVFDAFTTHTNISHFAHIIGGLMGSFFGFLKPTSRA